MSSSAAAGWSAELELGFVSRAGRTVLERRRHRGPLVVQRPFVPEGPELLHTYLLHPPGGIVSGDTLSTEIVLTEGARALLTTPAATKVYRRRLDAGPTRQAQELRVGPRCSAEWLPQETILFHGAEVALHTVARLEADAVFIGWEVLCFGRPVLGERFSRGECRQRLELWRDGRPLCLERMQLRAGSPAFDSPWGLAGRPVVGTLLASPPPAMPLDDLRALCAALPSGELAAVSVLEGALVARYLGTSVERCRALFVQLWSLLRPPLLGRPAVRPRIWST
jgi:urease accessory protein